MPYTPPAQHSPLASANPSPLSSRSHSYTSLYTAATSSRSDLPRSQSYLSRHRRTPSLSKGIHFGSTPARPSTDVVTSTITEGQETTDTDSLNFHGSVHQSPPAVTNSVMPAGAVISPADSHNNSSDDEDRPLQRQRGRDLGNLAELQAAIRIIEQHRESSPNRVRAEVERLGLTMPEAEVPNRHSPDGQTRLSTDAPRQISHSRSYTESAIMRTQPSSPSKSSDEECEEVPFRPRMVRKKSGELVKPALRPSNPQRRPSSMPGTPTFSKAVHFDNHLEHVRHFHQVDRPLAVSAGSSPVETYDGEMDFPFGGDEVSSPRRSPYEWEIQPSNFPLESRERKTLPVRVERIFLSADNKTLVGTVAVANIAFNKAVVTRFTLDYWKTTSEVVADYNNDVRRKQANDGCDRFNFNIRLADQANLQNKTLFFCVRYTVNGQEFWDNNSSFNFQVDFKRKTASNGRQSNSLPRSRPSQPVHARPVSEPSSFDDFTNGLDTKYDFNMDRPLPTRLVGETPIRLRQSSGRTVVPPEDLGRKQAMPSQAFGNRYDFGASLSAAISNGGGKKWSSSIRQRPEVSALAEMKGSRNGGIEGSVVPAVSQIIRRTATAKVEDPVPGTAADTQFPSEKAPLQSVSYHELLNKYCFFGSAKPSSSSPAIDPRDSDDVFSPRDVKDVAFERASKAATPQLSRSLIASPIIADPIKSRNRDPFVDERSSQQSPSRSRSPSPTSRSSRSASVMGSPTSFGFGSYHGPSLGFPMTDTTPTAILG